MAPVKTRRRRGTWQSTSVGLAATVVVLLVYAARGLDWLELRALDLRFRYANAIPESDNIVCIDIDDGSIETVGRWPWSRDQQAAIIDVLSELDARAVLYDITLVDPEPVRSIVPRQADVATDPLTLGTELAAIAFPDLELRAAIADIGNMYLAFDYSEKQQPAHAELRARICAWLEEQPERWRAAAHELYPELWRTLSSSSSGMDTLNAERTALVLRQLLGEAAVVKWTLTTSRSVVDAAIPVPTIAPTYYLHARDAKRCGFVVFEPDEDGVVRHMPLFAQYNGHLLAQLALALACDALGVPAEGISVERGALRLQPQNRETLTIPLDERGRALIPWVARRDWRYVFGEHVPADALWQVDDRRQAIRHNRALVVEHLAALGEESVLTDQAQYVDDLQQFLRLENDLRLARYVGDQATVDQQQEWITEYEQILDEGSAALTAALDQVPVDALTREQHGLIDELRRALVANVEHQREIQATFDRLRPWISGKLCLIGYTATALADMTPIPTHPRAPGVLAHANLLNGLLTGHVVSWAPHWFNLASTAVLGLLATLMSARWGPRTVAFVILAAVGYVAVAGWVAFYAWTYWIALTPAVGALLLSYVAVVIHRYLFLERESRQIAQALSQYTSATLARKMSEDAELCKRAEMREVTAIFTDLAGFTSISERIGAQRTQNVLNISLGCFSDVMLRREGMVNKFIGDGIFAFWNPVIYPQADHARRACETAVDLQAALVDLIDEQTRAAGDDVFRELVLRVGVATGNAVVGPCGSETKYDYTCIGDSVNVAARLESANKFYGTRILLSGATLEQAGDGFVTRALGSVQVKGKTQGVPIFELLGREGDVGEDMLRCAENFGRAVEAFQRRAWGEARRGFEQCAAAHADDLAARRYLQVVEQLQADPPAEDWNGALELTEK